MFNKNAFTIDSAFYFDVPDVRRNSHTFFPSSTNLEVRFNAVFSRKRTVYYGFTNYDDANMCL